ncbi:MAG: hypothetical protein OZ921_13010 [Sorangiineae bacterium]|nr:hypothetical protein [Polyangiaceae bacterium]MEB2323428.1 hypothetical protein [Sorangiineae bacterium]
MGLEIDFSEFAAARVREAVRDLMEHAPPALVPAASRLEADAHAVGRDDASAARFQSLLEIGYLVASADGFADEERTALAALLESVLGEAFTHDELDLHFRDLADGVEMLGRRERMRRAADDFDDGLSRSEALGFATLVAVADGVVAAPEARALEELGAFLGLGSDEVTQAVTRVTSELARRLRSGGAA